MKNTGERQVSPTIDGVRRDHVARYEFVAGRESGKKIIDAACGIGYGSKILANAGNRVEAIDKDEDAINYARQHYSDMCIKHDTDDLSVEVSLGDADVAVCFETIEHIYDPAPLLRSMLSSCEMLYASVPNEDVFPWNNTAFHYRHYTSGEFETLLNACGWEVIEWYGQEGAESEVEKDVNGRTLIAVCKHRETPKPEELPKEIELTMTLPEKVPEHVAILGLGPSVTSFLEFTKRLGGRNKYCDEVWGINALGNVFNCDRVFHMDDVRIQEIRAKAKPDSNIATMQEWLKTHPGPVYTSRPHPDYPGLIAYPIDYVIEKTGYAYANSTAAHAVAFAVAIGVKKISLFGMDFTYAHSHHAEKGRACVEFWLGFAAARGIKISIPQKSSLMDGCEPQRDRLYGYDTVDVHIERNEGSRTSVRFTERAGPLPTAEEIENRYDHTAHPNPLVKR